MVDTEGLVGVAQKEERPPCPQCGCSHIISWGKLRWRCSECGYPWPKNSDISITKDLRRYIHEPNLKGDYLVLFDTHYPFHHVECHQYMIKIVKKWDIKKCVIGGDVLELQEFKKYLDKHPDIKDWETELSLVQSILTWLATEFTRIDLVLGNHELRLWKALAGKGSQEDVFRLILGDLADVLKKKIKYYLYPCATINNSWIIDHPNMSSVIQARVPERQSSKYLVKKLVDMVKNSQQPKNGQMGYLSGHGHQGGEGTDVSGEFQVADGMVMCDPELFAYHKLKRSARPEWRVGFNIIKNNYLYRFPLKNTDWKFWLS